MNRADFHLLSKFLTSLTGSPLKLQCYSARYLATSQAEVILAFWRAARFAPFKGEVIHAVIDSAPVQRRQSANVRTEKRIRVPPLLFVSQPSVQTAKLGASQIKDTMSRNKRTHTKWQKEKKMPPDVGHDMVQCIAVRWSQFNSLVKPNLQRCGRLISSL
jgi:hypothetical protein